MRKSVTYQVFHDPECGLKRRFDNFLNENNFFDVQIESYGRSEVYVACMDGDDLVGVRKILGQFTHIVRNDPFKKRFEGLIREGVEAWYLQAIAVIPSYRGMGVGKMLLQMGLAEIPDEDDIFTSLMDSNVMRSHYLNKYGFKCVGVMDERMLLARQILR